MDEVRQVSYSYTSANVIELIGDAANQQQPPLDYLVGWLIAKVVPFSETAARLPAFVFGSALIPLVYLLGLRYLRAPDAGPREQRAPALVAAGLIAISPLLVEYAQEARPYSIFFFAVAVTLLALHRALRIDSPRSWLAFTFALLFMLLARGMAPVTVILGLLAATALHRAWFGGLRTLQPPVLPTVPRKSPTTRIFVSCATALIAYLPLLWLLRRQSRNYLNGSGLQPDWIQLAVVPLTKLPAILDAYFQPWHPLILLLFLAGCVSVFVRRERPLAVFLVLFAVAEPVIHTYAFHVAVNLGAAGLSPKYFLHTQIPICLLAAQGACWLPGLVQARWRRLAYAAMAVALAPMTVGFGQRILANYAQPKTDYRAAGLALDQRARPGDVIVCKSFKRWDAWEPHVYGQDLYFKAQLPQFTLAELLDWLPDHGDQPGRAILLIHDTIADDMRLADTAQFEVLRFPGLALVIPRATGATVRDSLATMVDEMLRFYPNDSSRMAVYVAKASLSRQADPQTAMALRLKAQALVPGGKLPTAYDKLARSAMPGPGG